LRVSIVFAKKNNFVGMAERENMNSVMFIAKQDAEYVLEPVAVLLQGQPKRKARAALRASARRFLRLAAKLQGVAMTSAGVEASQVVARLDQTK
jgi:hypothetical protein